MRNRLTTLGVAAILVVLSVSVASAASRGTTFTPIGLFPLCGTVPEGEFCESFPLTTAVAMTADGKTITGMHAFFSGTFVWTADTGLQTLGPVDGAGYIARDGSAIASTPFVPPTYSFSQSAMWAGGFWPDTTWDLIPTAPGFAFCDASGQSVHGISDDGGTVVGLTWIDEDGNGNGCDGAIGFAWDGSQMSLLDNSLRPGEHNRANAANEDGTVIVGFQQTNQREAAKWVNGVESFLCPDAVGGGGENFCTEGWDVTPDGNLMLTSMATINDFNIRATIVDQAGNYEQLPFPDSPHDPFWDTFNSRAMSDDGDTVVGAFGGGGFFGSPPFATMWSRGLGMTIDLQVFLLGQGLDELFFWYLDEATAVNGDGTILAGTGINPDQWLEAWTVDISRVKVCHKPEGEANGSNRTITVGWDGVADHLGHGDVLSTCEFAQADGQSRAMAMREAMVGQGHQDPAHDSRIGTLEQVRQTQRQAQASPFRSSGAGNPYPANATDGTSAFRGRKQVEGGQTPEQREQLNRRIERYRQR